MKKLVVLSVLLALMVMPAFASDVTLGGDARYGFISDFSGEALGFAEETDLTLDLTAVVDEINTVMVSFDGWEGGVFLDKAVIAHDLGAWLDLPVGVVLTVGLDDPDINYYNSFSTAGNEEIGGQDGTEFWGFDLLVDADMVQFELAMDPGYADDLADGQLLVGLAAPDLMGVSAEFYYYQGGLAVPVDEYGEGNIVFDAGYTTEISGIDLSAGAAFTYFLADAPLIEWLYAVSVAVGYDMFGLDISLLGDDVDTLGYLTGNVSVSPVELADLYVYFEMALYDGATETFQGAEIGVDAHVGAADMFVGYQINNDLMGTNNAPAALADGGFFVKWDINY